MIGINRYLQHMLQECFDLSMYTRRSLNLDLLSVVDHDMTLSCAL